MVKVLWVPTADYWASQQGVNDHLTRGTGREKAQATCCVLASRDNCGKATSAIGDLLQYVFRKTSHPLQVSHKPRRVEKA